jgi:hypothetical protein
VTDNLAATPIQPGALGYPVKPAIHPLFDVGNNIIEHYPTGLRVPAVSEDRLLFVWPPVLPAALIAPIASGHDRPPWSFGSFIVIIPALFVNSLIFSALTKVLFFCIVMGHPFLKIFT